MYKLLIVDDEPFILDGLTDLFEEYGELDVYKASSTSKAITLLNRTRMDIVVTDIRMPGESGLELLKLIRNQWPYCKVVILSAYSEFDYAHQAIVYRAEAYVLKSEGEKAIAAAVERCIEQIKMDMTSQKFLEVNQQYMTSALPILQSACIHKVIVGEPAEEYLSDFNQYQITLDPRCPVVLVMIHLDEVSKQSTAHSQLKVLLQIKIIFNKYLSDLFTAYETIIEGESMIWILQQKDAHHSLLYLKETLEIVQTHCMQAIQASVSIIYDDYANWDAIPTRFRMIMQLLTQLKGNGDERVLASSRFYLGKDNEHKDTHHNPSTSSHSQNFVTRIKRYINQHLADDLSLAALAEEFYINPVYMSRLYKQTTGYNLSEYITHKRIDNSERLLLNTEMKINHIAKECGYDSAAYFTRVFKKQKGMSPQKFRDLHSPPSQDENI